MQFSSSSQYMHTMPVHGGLRKVMRQGTLCLCRQMDWHCHSASDGLMQAIGTTCKSLRLPAVK